jgi:protein SCO1
VTSAGSPPDGAPEAKKPLYKNPFLIAFVVGAVALTVLPFLQKTQLRAPEPISHLGDWSLVDQWGKPLGSKELAGKVWVASFFFSRCPSICPPQQRDFLKILDHVDDLDAPIELVSFSVDPEHDKPEILNAYERKLDATGTTKGKWHLVTGSKETLKDILIKRFMVDMGDARALDGSADLFDISHSAKFVLVDQNGAVRGYWSADDLGRGNLINAARLLAKRGPNP